MKILVLMALFVPCARAQVVAWRGGDSTLSDEAGIGATIYFPNDTSTVGGGFEDGSFRFGAATTFDWKGNEITAGDATQSFNTSIGAGTYLASRGLTVIRKRDKWRAAFFMGGTGNTYSSPFFQATQPSHFGTGFMFACLTNDNFNIIRKLQDEDEKELAMSNNAQNQVGGAWEKTTEPELDPTEIFNRSRFVLEGDLVILQRLDGTHDNCDFEASDLKTLEGLQDMCTDFARKQWVTPWHLVDLLSIHRAMVDPSHDPNDVASF